MGRHSERAEEASASASASASCESDGRRNFSRRYSSSSSSENEDDDIHSSARSKTQRREPNRMPGDEGEPSISDSGEMKNNTRPPRNDNARRVVNSRGRRPPYGRRRWNGNHHPRPWQSEPPPPPPPWAGIAPQMNYTATPPPFPCPFGSLGQQMPGEFPVHFLDPSFLYQQHNCSSFTAPPPSMPSVVPRPAQGKGPTRAYQNDYAQYFVDTGIRPQNFIRDPDMAVIPDDYPQLKELMKLKDEQILKRSFNPIYLKCDLRETQLSRALFGTKFDAILIDPPMEEYVRRAPGVLDASDCWTWDEIRNLQIEAIADNPCFIFLWVGSSEGLEEGRLCLKKWGFKRIDDICWLKTNLERKNMTDLVNCDSSSIFKRTKEHCLVGIKGCVAPNMNDHLMHPNIDVDIVISEEPPYGSTQKPDYVYRIIEHLVQGRRRIEIFGEDHNLRRGWLTVGNGLSSSNFNLESYVSNFANSEGKVWEGAPLRLVPMDAPHLAGTTSMIEDLRPKSPQRKRQGENCPPN